MRVVLLIILFMISVEDIIEKRIMNLFLFLIISIKAIYLMINFDKSDLLISISGGFVAALTMIMCKIISKEGIGAGDIGLIISVGFYVGFKLFLSVLFLISIISLMFSLILLATKKANKNTSIPFAPFVFAGILVDTLIEVIT